MALESQLKWNSALSIRSRVMDEEVTRPVSDYTWLGLVYFVSLSALTVLVGWWEGHAH